MVEERNRLVDRLLVFLNGLPDVRLCVVSSLWRVSLARVISSSFVLEDSSGSRLIVCHEAFFTFVSVNQGCFFSLSAQA